MIRFPAELFAMLAVMTQAFSDEPAPFTITLKRADDRAATATEKGRAVVTIESPQGISGARIERIGETWPDAITIRLRLKGLENFSASHGELKLNASVSSPNAEVRVWKGTDETRPLKALDPLWPHVRLLDASGKPTTKIPLENGVFELTLPRLFFEGNPRAISLTWIDFYRN